MLFTNLFLLGEPVHRGSIHDDFTVALEASDDELQELEVLYKNLAKKGQMHF